jgi:aspartate/methionine/tyrosine aminotransferase
VAEYYNHLYRQGKDSKYSFENVCIVPGGRAGLTRCMAAMGNTQVGYFTPDYTAYQQSLGLFVRITPSPLLHKDANEGMLSFFMYIENTASNVLKQYYVQCTSSNYAF